jgi:copper chaperone NosL
LEAGLASQFRDLTKSASDKEIEMNKKAFVLATMFLFVCLYSAALFAQEDIQKHPACKYCGMDREKFSHSRILITYDDGSTVGTCSIHCAAIDLAVNIDKTPLTILVGDYWTKKLIPVEEAVWVLGGSKMGVMTKRAKWAFKNKEDALKYIAENGGKEASFEEIMKAAYEDMYEDTKMIRERKRERKMHHKE